MSVSKHYRSPTNPRRRHRSTSRFYPRGLRTHRLLLESLEERTLLSLTVATNKPEYAPEEPITVSISGFTAGETVELTVLEANGTANTGLAHESWQVTDGSHPEMALVEEDVIGGGGYDLDGVANGAKRSRLDEARKLLGTVDKPGLIDDIAIGCGRVDDNPDAFDPIRMFAFSDAPRRIASVDQLRGSGERTNLYAAMNVAETTLRGVPLAAVVLVTDGSYNDGGAPQDMARILKATQALGAVPLMINLPPVWTSAKGDEEKELVSAYNEAILALAEEHTLPYVDAYGLVMAQKEPRSFYAKSQTKFSKEGHAALSDVIEAAYTKLEQLVLRHGE